MNCSVLHKKMTDYVEKRLTALEMQDVEQHLVQCEQARKLHYELTMLYRTIGQDSVLTVTADFDDRVLTKVANLEASPRLQSSLMYRLSVAAAVAASIVLGIRLGTTYTAAQQNTTTVSSQDVQLLADAEQEQYEAVLYGN